MTILDGKKARTELKQALIERVRGLLVKPHLVIVQVGTRADSNAYISSKKKFAADIGARETHIKILEKADSKVASNLQQDIIRAIENANVDPSVHGIIVQLPLPLSIDADAVVNAIDPKKDVDGLTAENTKKWLEGREDAIWPATTRGIRELLAFYGISLDGKRVAMIGRSALVGKPTAAMCVAENASVTVCHSKTPNTAEITKASDVIIVAIGKPHFIDPSYVREGQVIVDVGITSVEVGTEVDKTVKVLQGDVDFDAVVPILGESGAITPVPGGVGPVTVLALFENLVDACYNAGK